MKAFLGLLSVIIFLLLITACEQPISSTLPEQPPAPASASASIQAADVTTAATPVKGAVYNSCTKELVDYTGTVHTRRTRKIKNDGSESFQISINIKGAGTGRTTGNSYQFIQHQTDDQDFEFGPPYPSVRELERSVRLVSQGSSTNAYVVFRNEVVVNASGQVVSRIISGTTSCQ